MKNKIKHGKITMTITIAISCFALAFIMTMQFKIVRQTDITEIENMRETELRTELANWKAKYEEAEEKYNETNAKIEEYKKTKQSNEETEKLVNAELEQVNMNLGKTDVEGEGIEVILRETGGVIVGFKRPKDLDDKVLIVDEPFDICGRKALCIRGLVEGKEYQSKLLGEIREKIKDFEIESD